MPKSIFASMAYRLEVSSPFLDKPDSSSFAPPLFED